MPTTKNEVVRERVLKSPVYGYSSRFEVGGGESSLVRVPPNSVNEREEKESGPKGIRTPDPRHVKAVS